MLDPLDFSSRLEFFLGGLINVHLIDAKAYTYAKLEHYSNAQRLLKRLLWCIDRGKENHPWMLLMRDRAFSLLQAMRQDSIAVKRELSEYEHFTRSAIGLSSHFS